MADAENPFTLVYNALWNCLLAHPKFIADVREGNRISFIHDANRDPLKQAVQSADLPEVILDSQQVTAQMYYSSTGSKIIRNYAFLVSTGDFRIQKILYQVEWEIFCAMHGWTSILTALKWPIATTLPDNRPSFVKRCDIVSANDGQFDNQRNRNINGWSAIWACEVEMHFAWQDLKDELTI